jgi:hypothetical protein
MRGYGRATMGLSCVKVSGAWQSTVEGGSLEREWQARPSLNYANDVMLCPNVEGRAYFANTAALLFNSRRFRTGELWVRCRTCLIPSIVRRQYPHGLVVHGCVMWEVAGVIYPPQTA